MSVDNTPIIISAPIGGLGRQLAALVDYAVNPQVESTDLYRTLTEDSGKIPVSYTTETPSEIAKTYPNGRIIQVTTTDENRIQLAYNYLVIEQWRVSGTIVDTFYIDEVKTILGESELSIADTFSDSQFMDNTFVQMLIGRVASSKLITPVETSPRASITVDFGSICCPANTAGNANIKPIIEFLGKIDRAPDELSALWYTFIRSCHHAKRNILNTANWS